MEDEQYHPNLFQNPDDYNKAIAAHIDDSTNNNNDHYDQSNRSFYDNIDYNDYSLDEQRQLHVAADTDDIYESNVERLPSQQHFLAGTNLFPSITTSTAPFKQRCFSEPEVYDHHHQRLQHKNGSISFISSGAATISTSNDVPFENLRHRSYTADAVAQSMVMNTSSKNKHRNQEQRILSGSSNNHTTTQAAAKPSSLRSLSSQSSSSSSDLVQFLLCHNSDLLNVSSDDVSNNEDNVTDGQIRRPNAILSPSLHHSQTPLPAPVPSTTAVNQQQQQRQRTSSGNVNNHNDVNNIYSQNNALGTAAPITTNNVTDDTDHVARLRYVRINRRFQYVIATVVVLFSILLFALFVTWIFFTSAMIMYDPNTPICSDDETNHLKSQKNMIRRYYYLSTIQLVITIFHTAIMRAVCCYRQQNHQTSVSRSNHESSLVSSVMPGRVLIYYILYFCYALFLLRSGICIIRTPMEPSPLNDNDHECLFAATQITRACFGFIALSILAGATIIFGYVLPFCIVAVMLTTNGYNPNTLSSHLNDYNGAVSVFPSLSTRVHNSSTFAPSSRAPSDCIDHLPIVNINSNLTTSSDNGISISTVQMECCICMEYMNYCRSSNEDDEDHDVLVIIPKCQHVFHKKCCKEWLRQSRTCPVCRNDIPSSLPQNQEDV